MTMKHIFVSYAHEDKNLAKQITSRLRGAGRIPWQDLRIRAGDNWQSAIDDALLKAEALVVVMSPHATKSQYVTYEWAFAFGAGIRVIPILWRDTELHPKLKTIQYIDFTPQGRKKPWVLLDDALPKLPSTVDPQIRAEFSLVDGKPEKEGNYYRINIYVRNTPPGTNQVTYEFHDETLKRAKLRSTVAATDFKSSILSNGDSLLSASIRTAPKKLLRINSSLSDALQRGHGSHPKPPIKSALAEFQK